MMHIDVRECRCGSMKIVTGRGYSTDKIIHDFDIAIKYAQKYHDTRTS